MFSQILYYCKERLSKLLVKIQNCINCESSITMAVICGMNTDAACVA